MEYPLDCGSGRNYDSGHSMREGITEDRELVKLIELDILVHLTLLITMV